MKSQLKKFYARAENLLSLKTVYYLFHLYNFSLNSLNDYFFWRKRLFGNITLNLPTT